VASASDDTGPDDTGPDDTAGVEFDLLSAAFQLDPPGTFRALREQCPVHHTDRPAPHWSLSREADVVAALRDDETWSSKYGPGLAYGQAGQGVLVSSDPPVHTDERLAISRAFRPSVLEAMEPDMRVLVDELVAGFADRGEGDLINDLAMPLPLTVMCWLLGMPVDDIGMFRSWVLPMAEAVALEGGRAANEQVIDAYRSYAAYFGPHIARRAEAIAAGDDVPGDLLTRLLTVERNGNRLTQQQVIGFCQFLLVAGSATTTLLIGNVVHRLMQFPDQLALVQADRSLIPHAIEESLRFDAPVHGLFRTNTCPVTLHGVEIPVDSKVYMMFGSANRDPEAWDHADRFDVTRDLKDLKRHAAFGVGIHYCLGAPLSRIEGALALEAVLDRLPGIRPAAAPVQVRASVLNGFESLPVRWDTSYPTT
jgi:cytochrome P450